MALQIRRATERFDGPSVPPPVGRWDPVIELEQLNRRLAGYLDLWRRNTSLFDGLSAPPADIEETDDAYVVDIELPGVSKQDLDIEIADGRLTVRGERREKARVGVLRRRERTVGRFQYALTLPGDVDEDGMVVNLCDGVLTIRLSKPDETACRRVEP